MAIVDRKGNRLKVELSFDGKALNDVTKVYSDVSADSGVLGDPSGDRDVGAFHTHAGAELSYKDPDMIEIPLTVVHRNSPTSTLELLKETWNGTEPAEVDIRWAYDQGAEGALRTAAKCILRTNPYTGADPSSSTPVTKQLTFVTTPGDIYEDVVPAP